MLSKSQFVRGLQCHKSLWLYRNRPELREKPSATQQAIFDSGTDVGILAQQLFPGGLLIPFEGLSYQEQVEQTRQAIAAGVSTIYEATFIHDNLFVKVDILHRAPDGWELYEVKSSTGCKEVYFNDIAVQMCTAIGDGVPVVRAYLVHINTGYVRQGRIDVRQLFTIVEVTNNIMSRQEEVALEMARQHAMVTGGEPPTDIGPQCDSPYTCDFKKHCWVHIPIPSVFDLRDHGRPDPFALYRQGIVRFEEIPTAKLGWRQKLQVNGLLHQQDRIDLKALKAFLDGLWYPLCFLDFETTYLTPVPLFDGTRPYEQVPFQFSLHIQEELGGPVRHVAFLAEPEGDPQDAFMRALVAALPIDACILTYNQKFEIGILNRLADRLPHWRSSVDAITPSVRDLMTPFQRRDVYLWPMNGSYSIKQVLPALVPELCHKDLSISDGEMASSAFLRMRQSDSLDEIGRLRQDLLEYCHLDTWGMVKILERLRHWGRSES